MHIINHPKKRKRREKGDTTRDWRTTLGSFSKTVATRTFHDI